MKKTGFTLIEIIMVTAVMGIVMLMFSPLISAFTGAQDRLYNQSKVDSRLNEVVEFIKRDVRNAKSNSGGNPVDVFDNITDNNLITNGSTGKKIIIHGVDSNGISKDIEYYLDDTDLKLKVTTSSSIILSNVEIGEFKYEDKILLFHFKIDVPDRLKDKVRNEVRDVGITRINLQ